MAPCYMHFLVLSLFIFERSEYMPEVNKDMRQELYNLRQKLIMVKMEQDLEEIERIENQIKEVRKKMASDISEQIKEEKSRGKNN